MILLIDNYDSFTYNLAQFLGQLGEKLEVRRNDQITLDEISGKIAAKNPAKPCAYRHLPRARASRKKPASASTSSAAFAGKIPILGVCLGHQAIGYAFGGRVVRAPALMHGKTSRIHHDSKTIFRELAAGFRRHPLPFAHRGEEGLPRELEISAETDGLIMGLRHRKLRLEGVQFHPESVLTEVGMQLLRNFLSL